MSLCGANLNFDAVTEKASSLKDSLKSKLGGASGTFSSASDLKSLVSGKVTDLKSQVSGLLPEIPEIPALSLQSELTALSGFDLKTPAGLLSYKSKLASITDKFGGSLSSSGFSLDDIVSKAAPALSGAGDLLSGATSALGSVTSGATSALGSVTSGATSALGSVTSGATSALGSITSGATSALGSITSGATDALGAASGLLSGGLPSVPSFDICTDCPNFELPAGATEAIQTAQDTVLSSVAGVAEEFADVSTNIDFDADLTALTSKASKILADPNVQDKISSDIASGSAQVGADLEGLANTVGDITSSLGL